MRIAGFNIPDNKKIGIALTYVYGVGPVVAQKILAEAGIDADKRAKDLSNAEISKIQGVIDKKYKVGGELRQIIRSNVSRLREIQCYRGIRHIKGLPVRGQRTKTNNRTVRGNVRKTAGSGRRKIELK